MRILFIGNSHTYYNDMPQIFAALAMGNGRDVSVDTVTKGGWILHNYLDVVNEQSQKIERLSKEGKFDLCILQEQTLLPVVDFDGFESGVKRLTQKLGDACDSFLLYEVWGRGDGHPDLERLGMTFDTMSAAIADAYARVSRQLSIPISHAGRNFCKVVSCRPDIPLFNPDLVHATYEGSCLIALTHYHSVFGELPQDPSVLGLPEETTLYFMSIVGS